MDIQAILSQMDEQIARLEQARVLLGGVEAPKKRGRPGKSASISKPKRTMSPAARAKIAAAQKARWERQKNK